jgi:hypothetical protein
MKSKRINNDEAPNKFFAVKDAERRNAENRMLYTPTQQARAETLKDCAELAFGRRCYVSYGRRKKVSIKVDGARRGNSKFEEIVAQYPNTEKVVTNQAVIYRVPV